MSIVTSRAQSVLLEVVVLHPRDVPGAEEGNADRLMLMVDPEGGGLSPEPSAVSAITRETDLPVRVMLRLNDGYATTGGEFARLVGLAEDYLSLGATGLAFGFLGHDLEVDVDTTASLAETVAVDWTFHRAFDAALETERAWRAVQGIPGLTAVASAGSSRGLAVGAEELTARAAADPAVAALLMPAGGLSGEHVPWFVRAGVRQFQVGTSVRPGRSWSKSYVDGGHVRAWRMLLDDALHRALGIPVD